MVMATMPEVQINVITTTVTKAEVELEFDRIRDNLMKLAKAFLAFTVADVILICYLLATR